MKYQHDKMKSSRKTGIISLIGAALFLVACGETATTNATTIEGKTPSASPVRIASNVNPLSLTCAEIVEELDYLYQDYNALQAPSVPTSSLTKQVTGTAISTGTKMLIGNTAGPLGGVLAGVASSTGTALLTEQSKLTPAQKLQLQNQIKILEERIYKYEQAKSRKNCITLPNK